MASIRIASNHVDYTPDYGHLQIVYVDDFGVQSEIEVQAPLTGTLGYWDFRAIENHADDPYFGDADNYSFVDIDLGGRSAAEVWSTLSGINAQFLALDPQINYNFSQNSNSYA